MIPLYVETDRLELRVLDVSAADMITAFYIENRQDFERFDPPHSEDFYTSETQRGLLEAERTLLTEGRGIRFYIFLKEAPDACIGSVSFAYLSSEDSRTPSIGYKLAKKHRHAGYAHEAASALIPLVFENYGISRLEADILPENLASVRLATRLGFVRDEIPVLLKTCNSKGEVAHTRYFLEKTERGAFAQTRHL